MHGLHNTAVDYITKLCISAAYSSSLHISSFSFNPPAKNFCSHFKNAEM